MSEAGIIWIIDFFFFQDSPFTGLFKSGAQVTGFIRMGPAADFTSSLTPGLTPGIRHGPGFM